MLIYGLCGPQGSGKDSFANYLKEALEANADNPVKVRIAAWSDKFYAEVSKAFNCDVSLLKDRNKKDSKQDWMALQHCKDMKFTNIALNHGISSIWQANTPRDILILWGTKYRRLENENYFVEPIAQLIDSDVETQVLLLSGTRMDNEIELVRSYGGSLIHLTKPGLTNGGQNETDLQIEVLEEDIVINNDSDLVNLKEKAIEFSECIVKNNLTFTQDDIKRRMRR